MADDDRQPPLRLRYATVDDAGALAAVHVASWRAGYRALLPDDVLAGTSQDEARERWAQEVTSTGPTRVVVAERPGVGVIGFASYGPAGDDPGLGRLFTCYVHPDQWGTGAGRALLRAARRLLRAGGATTAELWVLDGNERAMGSYRADGWQPDGTVRDEVVAGAPVRLVRFVRSLGDEPYLVANRETWDDWAGEYARSAARAWAGEPSWGLFGIPDDRVGILQRDLTGLAVVELGCGTGYVSGWCLRRGARLAVGVDNSPAQLATASAMARRHRRPLHLVLGDAEQAPLTDASFDLAISEYGAAIWCDPHRWIPEASRLLRPGGHLVFLGHSPLLVLCSPEFDGELAGPWLRRPQRGLHRVEWPDTASVEFAVGHGEMVRTLHRAGFELVDLIELFADEGDVTDYRHVDAGWASRWPVEDVWIARKR